ncbi:hypothetical protein BC833DRAFT_605412 [Globomyces pollinis-pini]|nr:hypothetical protein BC833DRAFT_605412 [Globomyces pollinis-pini]
MAIKTNRLSDIAAILNSLKDYLELKFHLSVNDRVWFVKILFHTIISTKDYDLSFRFMETCSQLLKDEKLIEPELLHLPWKPLYKLLYSLLYPKHVVLPTSVTNRIPSLIKLVRVTNRYFGKSATSEILELIFPSLSIHEFDYFVANVAILTIFLPTNILPTVPGDIDVGNASKFYWLPNVFNLWTMIENSVKYDSLFLSLISRLIHDNYGNPEYLKIGQYQMNFLFSKGLKMLKLPVGSGSTGLDTLPLGNDSNRVSFGVTEHKVNMNSAFITSKVESFAKIIVYTSSPTSDTIKHFKLFLQAIENFAHPSNSGAWTSIIARLLQDVTKFLYDRQYEESQKDCQTPIGLRFTKGMIHELTSAIIPLSLMLLYGKNMEAMGASQSTLKYISWLNPEALFPTALQKVYPSLENLTESHRTIPSIYLLSGSATSLLRTQHYKKGGQHLSSLLQLTLPGLDINDIQKSITSLLFIVCSIANVPLFDNSKYCATDSEFLEVSMECGSPTATSPIEDESCRTSTGDFEFWIVQFVDKLFMTLENLPQNFKVGESSGNAEGGLLATMAFTCEIVFSQLSPQFEDLVLNQMVKKIENSIIPSASETVGILCGLLCPANPKKRLQKLLPLCCEKIKEELSHGASSKPEGNKNAANSNPFGFASMSDAAIHWYQSILFNIVTFSGESLLPYKEMLNEILDLMIEHCVSRRGYLWAGNLLPKLVQSLIHIYPREYRSHPTKIWHNADFQRRSYSHWGEHFKLEDVDVDWHVPNEPEKEWACQLVDKYSNLAISKLQDLKSISSQAQSTKDHSHSFCRWFSLLSKCITSSFTFVQPQPGFNHNNESEDIRLYSAQVKTHPISAGFLFTDPNSQEYKHWQDKVLHIRYLLLDQLKFFLTQGQDDVESMESIIECITAQLTYSEPAHTMKAIYKYSKRIFRVSKDDTVLPRSVLLKKLYVLHLSRVAHNLKLHPTTTLVHDLVHGLFDLSVTKYTKVRTSAQQALFKVLQFHEPLRYSIFDKCIAILNEPSAERDTDRLKGALFVLRNRTVMMGIYLYKFKFTAMFIKSILNLKNEEKPSTLEAIRKLYLDFMQNFVCIQFKDPLPDGVVSLAESIPFDPSEISRLTQIENEKTTKMDQIYDSLFKGVFEMVQKKQISWRFINMATTFLNVILSPKYPISAELMGFVTSHINDENPTIRKSNMILLQDILNILKDRSVAAGTNHSANLKKMISSESANYSAVIDSIKQFSEKPIDHDQRYFSDELEFGWFCWPKTFKVYQGSIFLSPFNDADSNAAQDHLSTTVNQPEFWKKSIEFLSQESSEGFRRELAKFYDQLFGLFPVGPIDIVIPLLKDLTAKTDDNFSQRAASELCAGIIRGSKHWGTAGQMTIEKEVIPILFSGIQAATTESIHYWLACLQYFFNQRDPNRYVTIISRIMKSPLDSSNPSFLAESKKLWLMKAVIDVYQFRMKDYCEQLLDSLIQMISTPYQQVRESLGRCIDACLQLSYQPSSKSFGSFANLCNSTWDKENWQVEGVFNPKISKLFNQIREYKKIPRAIGTPSLYIQSSKTGNAQILILVLCWFAYAVTSYRPLGLLPYFSVLGQHMIEMQEYSDPDLSTMASQVSNIYPNFPHSNHQIQLVLKQLLNYCVDDMDIDELELGQKSWHIKTRILPIIQVLFFRHLFSINESIKNDILLVLCRLIQDPQLEVRQLASVTLSGIIRCSERHAVDGLMKQFQTSLTENRLPKRNRNSKIEKDQEYSSKLNRRHAAVLGLAALALAFPYEIPDWMPSVLVQLAACHSDPSPINATVRLTFGEFKRTHQDNWDEHKLKFTEQDLYTVSDLLYSPSYYA